MCEMWIESLLNKHALLLIIVIIAWVKEEKTCKFLAIWAKDSSIQLVGLISNCLIITRSEKSKGAVTEIKYCVIKNTLSI